MTPIGRNFLSVIRRFKMAMTLNILGLSVAFAAFMVIMIQLDYDHSFDKFHTDYDKIFRMEFSQNTSAQAIICRPLADRFFESSPHILAGAITSWPQTAPFHAEKNGARVLYEENSITVSPSFFDVFTFDFVDGVKGDYLSPSNVFIPLSLSRKLFGDESAIGQQIAHSYWGNQTVMAVYRDFPANSIIDNCIYFAMREEENRQNWQNYSYYVYFRVDDPSSVPQLFENFKQNFDAQAVFGADFTWEDSNVGLRFTALPDIHYVTDVLYDRTPKASRQTLLVLFAIAIIIVMIAEINFTNFSTALTPMRIRNINTQKVLGARQGSIRLSLVSEAMFISLLSFLVAICLMMVFYRTSPARLVDADLSPAAHPLIVGGTAFIALFAGLLAGLYPAWYMTSFVPALALKGNFGLSPKGKRLRNTLIGVQFISSYALIIGVSFMYLQNHYMQHSSLGYDRDELITADISRLQQSRDAFITKLKAYSGIKDVTHGEVILSSSDQYMGWGRKYRGKQMQFQCLPVDYTFLKVMGIEITEGRDFRREDAGTQYGAYVFNETAKKEYDMEAGTTIDDKGEIIGFMPDVKFASFRTAVEPMAFYVWGAENWGGRPICAYIKVKAGTDKRAAMSYIRDTLAEFDAEYTFDVRFFDEVLQRLYEKETSLSSLITLFSLIAIFIAVVGVFGLVVFDGECRRKEIGIRKVLGASVTGIIVMFNKAYFRILAVCFVIAAPLAWYAVHSWLENFAYKTPVYWWVYVLAFVAVGIITACTVTFQNWRVATANPVKALKTE
ncbi:MAG: FtsX-like permease family protein [Bacteroidales bacterium]|nr:FtsX-like permease family protein [Bacteroidales bacterium]